MASLLFGRWSSRSDSPSRRPLVASEDPSLPPRQEAATYGTATQDEPSSSTAAGEPHAGRATHVGFERPVKGKGRDPRRRRRRERDGSTSEEDERGGSHEVAEEGGALKRWWTRLGERYSPVVYLENRASVARDHLANERTYLAWLRTSLSLTSIGVAIAQLFRLTGAVFSPPSSPSSSAFSQPQPTAFLPAPTPASSIPLTAAALTSLFPPSPTLTAATQQQQMEQVVAALYAQVQEQAAALEELAGVYAQQGQGYPQLGKPIGVTFVALGLGFLVIGTYRYFRVQYVLQHGKYPTSRRSVIFGSFSVGAIVVAAFASILAVRTPVLPSNGSSL